MEEADPDAPLSGVRTKTTAVLNFVRQMREEREGAGGRVMSQNTQCPLPAPSLPLMPICHSVTGAHSALVSPFQPPVDPELSLYDSKDDVPSYWDLEQVS